MNIVFIKQHNHTLMLNLSKQLRIILLRSENKKKYYLYNIERQERLSASHDDDSKIIIRQYI